MHKPFTVANEERVRFVDSEVIDLLWIDHSRDRIDRAAAIFKRGDLVADFEVTGVDPLAETV
jgi:hypothetical protein